jgi:hypothetical protein
MYARRDVTGERVQLPVSEKNGKDVLECEKAEVTTLVKESRGLGDEHPSLRPSTTSM